MPVFRPPRRRFVGSPKSGPRRLLIATFAIITISTLILLPGYTTSSFSSNSTNSSSFHLDQSHKTIDPDNLHIDNENTNHDVEFPDANPLTNEPLSKSRFDRTSSHHHDDLASHSILPDLQQQSDSSHSLSEEHSNVEINNSFLGDNPQREQNQKLSLDHHYLNSVEVPKQENEKEKISPISVIVLFHNEYPTLNHTLSTWQSDLLPYISEIVFFLNGVSDPSIFFSNLPILETQPWKSIITVHSSEQNLRLGIAIINMVRLAKHDHVLLLEKDWSLIEPSSTVYPILRESIRLLDTSSADVVRFRHRNKPGAPLHARIMHQGREEQMLRQQSNLFCFMHHWIEDPTVSYSEYFKVCPNTEKDDQIWCSPSKYCQWTNNPCLFLKKWFVENLGQPFEEDFNKTVKTDPQNAMLDFEFYANWRFDKWNDRNFTVALPSGLFEHQEIGEQNLMNTVWYAWNRLHTDVEEKKHMLIDTEKKNCFSSHKSWHSGPMFSEKFPLDFVHMYHYNQSMQRTGKEAIDDLKEASKTYSKRLEEGHGTWRNAVTDLTNLWFKLSLYSYPIEPNAMQMVFVTSIYDPQVSPTNLNSSTISLNAIAANLDLLTNYKVLIYTTQIMQTEIKTRLQSKFHWNKQRFNSLFFHISDQGSLLEKLLTSENIQRVSNLYSSQQYQSVVKERNNGAIPSINDILFRIGKPYLLADAVDRATNIEGLSSATHFIWFNATTRCLPFAGKRSSSGLLSPHNDFVFRQNTILNPLLTVRKGTSIDEITNLLSYSGYNMSTLLQHMEEKDITNGVMVAEASTLAGSRLAIHLMASYYDFVLRDLLRQGQLGTEQEALSIVMKNVDYNFEKYEIVCRDQGQCPEQNACSLYAKAGICLSP